MREVCPHLDVNLKPSKCIPQIANKLNINGEIEDKCKKVADYLCKNELLTGRSPYTIAGVAVYMATQLEENNKKSFKDIGGAAELADATIRNAYKQVYHLRYDILEKLASKEDIDKAL